MMCNVGIGGVKHEFYITSIYNLISIIICLNQTLYLLACSRIYYYILVQLCLNFNLNLGMFIKINEHERAFSLFENNLIHLLHFFSYSHSPALYIRKDFFFFLTKTMYVLMSGMGIKKVYFDWLLCFFLFIYLFSKSTKIYTHRNFIKQKFSYPLKFPKNPATGP